MYAVDTWVRYAKNNHTQRSLHMLPREFMADLLFFWIGRGDESNMEPWTEDNLERYFIRS